MILLNEIGRLDQADRNFSENGVRTIAGDISGIKAESMKSMEEHIAQAPDYLNFERGIYIAFILGGVVKGDCVEYTTNFGVKLTTSGNRRTLKSFLGFRRANPDGTVDFLDEKWKVSGRGVCYSRKRVEKSV